MELASKSIITKIAIVMTALAVTLATAGASVGASNKHDNDDEFGYQGYAKDQCKHGGWKDLGFRNQGQCVKFFVHLQNGTVCPVNDQQLAELDAFFKVKTFNTTLNGQDVTIQKIIDGKRLTKKHLKAFLQVSNPSLECKIVGKDHKLFLQLVND